jgi:hypothetical protein
MANEKLTINQLADRLDGLERENRRLRLVGAVLFVGLVVLGVEAKCFNSRSKTIEAERFVIKDKEGRVHAEFGLSNVGLPALAMYDERGMEQVSLGVPSDHAAALTFYDRGDARVILDSSADASSALRFLDRDQVSHSALFMWPDGTTGMTFRSGEQGVAMGVQPNGDSAVFATDKSGQEIGRVGAKSVDAQSLGIAPKRVSTASNAADGALTVPGWLNPPSAINPAGVSQAREYPRERTARGATN